MQQTVSSDDLLVRQCVFSCMLRLEAGKEGGDKRKTSFFSASRGLSGGLLFVILRSGGPSFCQFSLCKGLRWKRRTAMCAPQSVESGTRDTKGGTDRNGDTSITA